MAAVLLVEDDPSLGRSLVERLAQEGYQTVLAATCQEATALSAAQRFDLAIVDVGLPDHSGFTLARHLKDSSNTAIVFLTAMNSAEYRLEGFEIGADDYIPKPFHLKELLLRIARVLDARKISSMISSAGVILNMEARTLQLPDGKLCNPQQRDLDVLAILIRAQPKALTRREILQALFSDQRELPTERTIDNSVVRLRELLGTELQKRLHSVRGIGYRWQGD